MPSSTASRSAVTTTPSSHFGFTQPPARRRRIELFAAAYGIDADGLVDAAIARQHKYAEQMRYLHDRGLAVPWTTTASVLAAERMAQWSEANRPLFE